MVKYFLIVNDEINFPFFGLETPNNFQVLICAKFYTFPDFYFKYFITKIMGKILLKIPRNINCQCSWIGSGELTIG